MKPFPIILGATLATGLAAAAIWIPRTAATDTGCTKPGAYAFTRAEVTHRLAAPSTAEFPAGPPAPGKCWI